jgi:oxygen-independent coproporphyrinogen III oxidase
MSRPTSGADLGVYVHVPFCEHVCPYCDFAVVGVGRLSEAAEADWLALVLAEWGRWRGALAGRSVASVYFGGGTPSLLRAKTVGTLLETLAADLAFGEPEITVELNPGQLEVARVPELRALGVTRLSVGLQSTDAEVLRRLGRAQSRDEALRGLEACLAAGFASVSADLIYGAPGQTVAQVLADAERLVALGVPHVSAYALTLEGDTPFVRAEREGKLALPDEDAVVEMSRRLRAALNAAGIAQYEISSFARAGQRSRHNQRYWLRRDVLGLGPSAASFVLGRRLRNAPALDDWRRALRAGDAPAVEDEAISTEEARREALYLGLRRLDGVSRAAYLREFGAAPEAFLGPELRRLRARELVLDQAGHLRLSERGILFADEVFQELVGR